MSNINQKVDTASNRVLALGEALESSRKAKIGEKKDAGSTGKLAKQAIEDLVKDRDCLFLPPKQLNSLENMEKSLRGFSRITLKKSDGTVLKNAFDEAITQVHTIRDNAKVIANLQKKGYSEELIKDALDKLSYNAGEKIDQKALENKCKELKANSTKVAPKQQSHQPTYHSSNIIMPNSSVNNAAKIPDNRKANLERTYGKAIVDEVANLYKSDDPPGALERECENIMNRYAPPIPEYVKNVVSYNLNGSDESHKSNDQKGVEKFLKEDEFNERFDIEIVNGAAKNIHEHRKQEMKSKRRSEWIEPKNNGALMPQMQAAQLYKACAYAKFKNDLCKKHRCIPEVFDQVVQDIVPPPLWRDDQKVACAKEMAVGKKAPNPDEFKRIEKALEERMRPA